jgi:L-rhamnose isomerase
MNKVSVQKGYEYAKARYADLSVDTDKVMEWIDSIPISMNCWQGDDVLGFDSIGELTGGISATGNYPGRARTPGELRADIDKAFTMIPGTVKLNLHACYAEKNGRKIDRDSYTAEQFENWIAWAKEKGIGMDFNPTYFSHPMMDGNFSLASRKPEIREFWIEHGKRCRKIGLEFAEQLGKPCVVNYWMPDGYKDTCADTVTPRKIMASSLDAIFKDDIDKELVPCSIESKLFGLGVESYTVVSHEFALGYAVKKGLLYCLDAGHFHPTEAVSAKISSLLAFTDKLLLHLSRGVRWDSDHVITLDDELQRIMDEVIWNGFENRIFIGLDYFDASINRIACWVIGMRNARKALLSSALAPYGAIREAENNGDYTLRLALQEERKTLPFGAVWDYYCMGRGVGTGDDWISDVRQYEKDVLSKR